MAVRDVRSTLGVTLLAALSATLLAAPSARVAAQPAPAPGPEAPAPEQPAPPEGAEPKAPAQDAPAQDAPAQDAPAEPPETPSGEAEVAPTETPAPVPAQGAPPPAGQPADTEPQPVMPPPGTPPPSPDAPPIPPPAQPTAPAEPSDEPLEPQPEPTVVAVVPEPLPEPPLHLGAGVSVGVLNLPSLGVGATLYAQIAPEGFWPIELSGTYFFDNEHELGTLDLDLVLHPQLVVPFPREGSRTTFNIAQFAAALCPYDRALSAGRLFLCAGAYGGVISSETEGFVLEDGSEQRALFGFEAYVRWRFRLAGPLALTYSVGLVVPVTRDRFGYEDRFGDFQEIFQATPVGGRVGLMLVLGF